MNRKKWFQLISFLLEPPFYTVRDTKGNEYVLLQQNEKRMKAKYLASIEDKTVFEACENHIHLFLTITKEEMEGMKSLASALGVFIMEKLYQAYPEKTFVVYTSLGLGESLILRFHQRWEGETDCFDLSEDKAAAEKYLFKFERLGSEVLIHSNIEGEDEKKVAIQKEFPPRNVLVKKGKE